MNTSDTHDPSPEEHYIEQLKLICASADTVDISQATHPALALWRMPQARQRFIDSGAFDQTEIGCLDFLSEQATDPRSESIAQGAAEKFQSGVRELNPDKPTNTNQPDETES